MFGLRSILSLTVTGVALSLFPILAEAAIVQVNSQGDIKSIQDLAINGTLYNVDFVYDTFHNLFGKPNNLNALPKFWQNPIRVHSARDAIDRVLEVSYPARLAINDEDVTLEYIIPQGLVQPFNLIAGSTPIISDETFSAVWGTYREYYDNRSWSEFCELLFQAGYTSCSRSVFTMPNLEEIFGVSINSPRLFATFVPSQPEPIPEQSNLIGILGVGVCGLLLRKKSSGKNKR
jgi:hypothetical protein